MKLIRKDLFLCLYIKQYNNIIYLIKSVLTRSKQCYINNLYYITC